MFNGTIIGYRAWRINPETFELRGPVSRIVWPNDGKLEAQCEDILHRDEFRRVLRDHATPGDICKCGIYAFHDVDSAMESYCTHSLSILGVAAFWGRIAVHSNGFRAQYARPLALADHKEFKRKLGWSFALEGVRALYNIPVIPVDLLEPYGLTFGEPLGVRFEDDIPG